MWIAKWEGGDVMEQSLCVRMKLSSYQLKIGCYKTFYVTLMQPSNKTVLCNQNENTCKRYTKYTKILKIKAYHWKENQQHTKEDRKRGKKEQIIVRYRKQLTK